MWATVVLCPLAALFAAAKAIWSLKTGEISLRGHETRRHAQPIKFWYLFLIHWVYVFAFAVLGTIAADWLLR